MKTIPLTNSEAVVLKKCSACGCRKPHSAFAKNRAMYDGLSNICKECRKLWCKSAKGRRAQEKWRKSSKGRRARDKYAGSDKQKACSKKYRETIRGQLVTRFNGVKGRCERPGHEHYYNYGECGIELRFTRDEFVEYMLKYWPMDSYTGCELHRIDNDGHYEPGNVEMLTMDEHRSRHVEIRADNIPF